MKKLVLPALAVLLAVGGAFASNKFAPVYFLGDDQCIENSVPQPCVPGIEEACTGPGNVQYYTKPDASSPATECEELFYDEQK